MFVYLRSPMLPVSARLLDSSEYKTLQNRNGKFILRDFLGKMGCNKQCLFTVDLLGCLPENTFLTRCFKGVWYPKIWRCS